MKNVIEKQMEFYGELTKSLNKQMEMIPEYAKKMGNPEIMANFIGNLPKNDINNTIFESYLNFWNSSIEYQKYLLELTEKNLSRLNLIKK